MEPVSIRALTSLLTHLAICSFARSLQAWNGDICHHLCCSF